MSRHRVGRVVAAAAIHVAVFASTGVAAQAIPSPTFTSGDLRSVACRVTRSQPAVGLAELLHVEVHNRGAHAFEPTLFRCTIRSADAKSTEPRIVDVARVPLPRMHRVGRVVAPRQKANYALQLRVEPGARVTVAVVDGLFSDTAGIVASPVAVGALTTERVAKDATTLPATGVALRNSLPHTVDVVLRAKCTEPRNGTVLLTATVGANGEGVARYFALPVHLQWDDPLEYLAGCTLTEIEVVDWSVRVAAPPEPAAALAQRMYESWLGSTTGLPAFRGRFHFVQATGGAPRRVIASGTFEVDAAGNVRAEGATDGDGAHGKSRIAGLLAEHARPTLATFLERNRFEQGAADLVLVHGPGWSKQEVALLPQSRSVPAADGSAPTCPGGTAVFRVDADGRLATIGTADGVSHASVKTVAFDGGYLVVERANRERTTVHEYAHRSIGGVVLPTRARTVMRDALDKVVFDEELFLEALTVDPAIEAVASAAPTGAGVDAVRAAWERIDRAATAKPTDLQLRFTVEHPGTDGIWVGQRKIDGKLTLAAFTGFAWRAPGFGRVTAEFTAKVDDTTASALTHALLDRLVMWTGLDPSAMPPFDEFFRGVEITPKGTDGTFVLSTGPYRELRLVDGRLASMTSQSGSVRRYTWQEIGGRSVPTRIESGAAIATAKWRARTDGIRFPSEIEFRDVFGKGWGPERLRFEILAPR